MNKTRININTNPRLQPKTSANQKQQRERKYREEGTQGRDLELFKA
ncbi:uncharacterized protein G2W53_039370 [Senna tora]|uniref:Uncharacterized protein n=1 Tax=Senna tora TaxID=362788 RepID=A0A834T181_9FABA|nr:uncharacterized protein G2W53_039370 [Senna tora]